MKRITKNVATMVNRRERETGICMKDILKGIPLCCATICLLVLMTQWIGFAAGFAVTMISALVLAAAYGFFSER